MRTAVPAARPARAPRGRRAGAATAAVAALVLLAGCGGARTQPGVAATATPPPAAQPTPTGPAYALRGLPQPPTDVVTGLSVPWDLVPLPDGTVLVTERDSARVLRVGADGSQRQVTGTGTGGAVGGVVAGGGGGLLGMAVSPTFAGDGVVYAFTTTSATEAQVVRMQLTGGGAGAADGGALSAPQPVLTGIPTGGDARGGALGFGPDGMLYVGTGDAGNGPAAEDPASLAGKVLRLTPDGAPAPGNPVDGSPVWVSGLHDVNGFTWDARGRMFVGDRSLDQQDELDLVQAGADYGWPQVQGSVGSGEAKESHTAPLMTWYYKDLSPQGMVATGDALYIAALRGQRLWRVPLQGESIGQPEAYLQDNLGSLRDVVAAPDGGGLWVLTCNTVPGGVSKKKSLDRVVRIPLA